MSEQRLYFLMQRYLDGSIDAQALSELQQLMGTSEGVGATLQQLFEEVYDSGGPLRDMPADRARQMLTTILSSEALVAGSETPVVVNEASVVGSETPVVGSETSVVKIPTPSKVRSVRRMALGWAAAALLFLAGGYLLYHSRTKTTVAVTHPDLPAGSSKAILTLAGGQQIVLGDSVKGQLAAQGGMRIIQLDSGQLTYVGNADPADVEYNTLVTSRGGQYKVTLPDGTRVWLNSASRLKYPTAFTGATRKVELSGEAYFEVSKNSRQPFTVSAGGMQVDVLGTDFNINAYGDEDTIRTTLVNGAVRLVSNAKAGGVTMQPGQQGSFRNGGDRFVVSHPDVQEVLAWKNGEFIFYGQPIQVILRQMSRWYDADIEYRGTPPSTLFNGNISRTSKASALLDLLETIGDVHFEIDGHKIIVLPGRRT